MSDGEYDVFGDLDALCKKQTLKHFEAATSQPNSSDDELDLVAELRGAKGKPRSPDKNNSRKSSTKQWSPELSPTSSPSPPTIAKTRVTRSKLKATMPDIADASASMLAVSSANAKPNAKTARSKAAKSATVASGFAVNEMTSSMAAVMNTAIQAAAQAAIEESSKAGTRRTRSINGQLLAAFGEMALPPPSEAAAPKKRAGRQKRASPADALVAALAAAEATTTTFAAPPVPIAATVAKRGRPRGNGRATQNTLNSTVDLVDSASNNVTRVRDLAIAEKAARAPTVGFVDLVSSPITAIHGVINVDSDGDGDAKVTTTAAATVSDNASLDISFEEENPELSVKVIWNGAPEVFKLRKYQKFQHLFKTLAARENTNEENIVCNLDSKIITAQDTPDSIGYKIYHFIDGRVLRRKLNETSGPLKKVRDANRIALKIQSDLWKRPLLVDLQKTEKFKILYIKCAEELNIPYANLKLSFDGEHMDYNATPMDLELEGGEAIDLRIRK